MSSKDYYKILQVAPTADLEVISAAYRILAHRYHPDINKSPQATFLMQEINAAYGVLSDPFKRQEYDRERVASARLASYCPRDFMSLEPKSIYDGRIDQCPHCHGLWIERGSLQVLYRQQGLDIPWVLANEDFYAIGLNAGQLDCPNDATRMARIEHRGIEIDICSKCLGIWFDKEELEKIMILAPSKGQQVLFDRPTNVVEDMMETLMAILEFTKGALNDILGW